MPPSSSCVRCRKPLEIESASGLCQTCQIASETSRLAPNPDAGASRADTASFHPTGSGRLSSATARGTGTPTLAAPAPQVLPHPPLGYELIRKLDSGGMGDVYLAREQAPDREVAIKFLRGLATGGALDRFLIEIRSLADLKHPNIVQVLATDFYRSDPFFTMDYEPGGTLGGEIKKNGPLPPRRAAELIRVVAGAIQAAHDKKILHRDLKPSNILLAADGSPKVSDFGLAKRTDKDDGITVDSGAIGTPAYMPPEQFSKKYGQVGPRSDVYGLGATLYHLLTGRPPFRGDTHSETMNKVLRDLPVRPRAIRPDIPMALEAIVLKCLEKKPDDRYPTATALAESLGKFLAGQADPDSPPYTPLRRLWLWLQRNRVSLAGTAVGVLFLFGVYALMIGQEDPPQRTLIIEKDPPPLVSPPVPPPPLFPPIFAPEMTYERVIEDVQSGKRVVLVDEMKPRVQLAGGLGSCEILPAKAGDTLFSLKTRGIAVLQLLNDPGVERYRLRAEVRQDQTVKIEGGKQNSRTARVGLVFGHSRVRVGSETIAHRLLTVGFNENDGGRVGLTDSSHLERTLQPLVSSHHTGVTVPFDPSGPASDWRVLEVDVTPEWITIRQGDKSASCSVSELRSFLGDRATGLRADQPGEGKFGFPEWTPRLAIGLWVSESWVSFRNVTIEALPAPKGE